MKFKKLILPYLLFTLLYTCGNSQTSDSKHSPLEMDSILKQGPEYDLIKPLIGNWKVVQTVYAKEGGKILVRDTFKVERKMIGNFLQEIMQPVVKSETTSFTRTSYLNYNRTNRRWEYIVLDTRYPVMMFEISADPVIKENKDLHLYLDGFIVPPFLGKEYAGMFAKEHRIITL